MLRKILKRTLATLIVLIMVFTTFFIFDPSFLFPVAEASVSKTNVSYADFYFVVPEAIYLTPAYNSYSVSSATSYTFQWYLNNTLGSDLTITPTTGEQGTGKIYFNYANATNMSLKFKWQSVPGTQYGSTADTTHTITYGNSTAKYPADKGSGTMAYTFSSTNTTIDITAGNSPALAAATTGAFICWMLDFDDSTDGQHKQVYAYTYVYKPYPYPIGVALGCKNTRGDNSFGSSYAWLSGYHSVSTEGSYYPRTAQGKRALIPFSSSKSTGVSVGNLYAQFAVDNSSTTRWGYKWLDSDGNWPDAWITQTDTDSSCAKKTFNYEGYDYGYNYGDQAMWTYTYSATGSMTVDVSRYSNMNQIPNVSCGLMVTDSSHTNGTLTQAWYLGNYTGSNHYGSGHNKTRTAFSDLSTSSTSYPRGIWTEHRTGLIAYGGNCGDNYRIAESSGVMYNGRWTLAVSSGTATGVKYISTGFMTYEAKDTCWNLGEIKCNLNIYDKTDLRAAAIKAMKALPSINSKLITDTTHYNQFIKLYRKVWECLGKIDGTWSNCTVNDTNYTSASALATALNNKVDALKDQDTGRTLWTAKQYNVRARLDGSKWKTVTNSNTSTTYRAGATVNYSKESYFGYTYKGYKNSADTTTSSSSSYTAPSLTTTNQNSTPVISLTKQAADSTYSFYYLRDEYSISYTLNGGTVSGTNPTSFNVETDPFTLKLTNPTKTGYTFKGWSNSNVLSGDTNTSVYAPQNLVTESSVLQYTESSPLTCSERDHHPGSTGFDVTVGDTYRVFVKAKRTAGTLGINGGLYYTAKTSAAATG